MSLLEIWGTVLGLEHVDPDANFFDVGGDSVRAARIAALAAQAGIPVSMADIFTYQTVAGLLVAIDAEPDGSPR